MRSLFVHSPVLQFFSCNQESVPSNSNWRDCGHHLGGTAVDEQKACFELPVPSLRRFDDRLSMPHLRYFTLLLVLLCRFISFFFSVVLICRSRRLLVFSSINCSCFCWYWFAVNRNRVIGAVVLPPRRSLSVVVGRHRPPCPLSLFVRFLLFQPR